MKTPSPGSIVRVEIGEIYHYGIFVNDSEVVQFGYPPRNRKALLGEDIRVVSSDIETFMSDGFVEVGEYSLVEKLKAKKPEEVIKIAKSRLGEGGYHLLYNNCEHFVYECVFGEKKCLQVENVRDFVSKIPKTDVFILEIPEEMPKIKLYPKERQSEIDGISNEEVKKQKAWAWVLLGTALKYSFDADIEKLGIRKNSNGKWESDKYFFSISHNRKYVALAVSNKAVGVDIEEISSVERMPSKEKLADKILCENEKNLKTDGRNITLLWTKKESIFKRKNLSVFKPCEIDTTIEKTESRIIDTDNLISVSSEFMDNISYFTLDKADVKNAKYTKFEKTEAEYVL